jgi:hypothetical protein
MDHDFSLRDFKKVENEFLYAYELLTENEDSAASAPL